MKYLEPFLIGALDMVQAGMRPSDAVSIGASDEEAEGLAHFLGVGSLHELDRMSPDGLRELLQPYALSTT